ncbi:hypothetical protein [Aliikangiella sp. IMCC44359]|uniref:hypothetical protein n=1 Tax=Aliikangiella sp. IMCC44359 TaxID=3459125 RepID=UPI00403B1F8C
MKKILIIFPDEWIAYSPSILNLSTYLTTKKKVEVNIICFDNGRYPIDTQSIDASVHIIKNSRLKNALLSVVKLHQWYKKKLIKKKASQIKFDVIIGVDLLGVKTALETHSSAHLFSLEIKKSDFLLNTSNSQIKSIAIQTQERYNYLFENQNRNTYYIQNAPDYNSDIQPSNYKTGDQLKVVCFGNLIPQHGVFQCIDYLNFDPDSNLTLTGRLSSKFESKIKTQYAQLIEKNRLILDKNYIPQSEVIQYLANFHIGLCFYDFNLIKQDDFNYISSPSGKLFNYYAAGMPVIANDILGLQSVNEFKAGVLLKEVNGESIKQAINTVKSNYQSYQQSAINAAKHFDFSKAVPPFAEMLLKDIND